MSRVVKELPQELYTWIQTVVDERPRFVQEDAKLDLVSWINTNLATNKRNAYFDMCVDMLIDALEKRDSTNV